MNKQMQAPAQAKRASDLRKAGSASNQPDADSSLLRLQQDFARLASALIVGAALALTYDGTMTFTQAHGAHGWRGATIAGMNDLSVLVGILWPRRPLQGLAGLCAAFTMWANLAQAAPGPAGLAVALIPPGLAILMVAALEYVFRHPLVSQSTGSVSQMTQTGEPVREPVSRPEPTTEPMSQRIKPVGIEPESAVSRGGLLSQKAEPVEPSAEPVSQGLHSVPNWTRESVLAWLAQDQSRTTAQAVLHTGLSKATINRWKAERAA